MSSRSLETSGGEGTCRRDVLIATAIAVGAAAAGSVAALLVIRSLPRSRSANDAEARKLSRSRSDASHAAVRQAAVAMDHTRSISAPGQLSGGPASSAHLTPADFGRHSSGDLQVQPDRQDSGEARSSLAGKRGRHSAEFVSWMANGTAATDDPRGVASSSRSRSTSVPSATAGSLRASSASWMLQKFSGKSWYSILSHVTPPAAAVGSSAQPGSGGHVLAGMWESPPAPAHPGTTAAQAAAAAAAAFMVPAQDATLQRQPTVAEALMPDEPQPELCPKGEEGADAATEEGTIPLSELQLYHHPDGKPWMLGKGSFGQVYKATWRLEDVAVKVFPCDGRVQLEERFRKEIELLRSCRHIGIVGFKAACLDSPGHLLMVMELMEGGDLRTALSADAEGHWRWYRREPGPNGQRVRGLGQQIAADVARGLAFLHSHHIVHLDLKSPNVLLTANQEAKIGDVGLARLMPNDYLSNAAAIGTFAWTAPEVLMGKKCSAKVDVFSLGVILWELLTGEAPHRGRMRSLRVPEDCSKGVRNLVAACMTQEVSARPSAAEVAELLSGDPATLNTYRANLDRDVSVSLDEEQAIQHDDRVLLLRYYNECNECIHGGAEAAAAAGYTEPPLESCVEGLRPFDGKSYSNMIDQLRALLESPDIEDSCSAPRQRLECLIKHFLPCYTFKLKLSTRVFQRLRALDVRALGKLQDSLPASAAEARAGGSASAAAVEAQRTSSSDTASVRSPNGGGGGSGNTACVRRRSDAVLANIGTSDEYAIDTSSARHEPPGDSTWRQVLAALRLTPEQKDAYVEARQRVGAKFKQLQDERRVLVANLRSLADDTGLETYDEAVVASAKLRANMQAESRELHDFQTGLICELLEPIQYARAEVAAFPAMHDGMPIGALLLEERGETAA